MYRVGQSTVSRSNLPTLKLHNLFNGRLRGSKLDSNDDEKTSKFLQSQQQARIENSLPFFSSENRTQQFMMSINVHSLPKADSQAVTLIKETWRNFTSTTDGKPDPRIVKFVPKED